MNKCAMEIYNKIVSAPIGEIVSTRHKNGKEYNYGIEDALKEQGYTEGKEFSRLFDWATAQTFIKKLAEIRPYEEPAHDIKVGDVFVYSWGYDQTNIEFYQVTATNKKTVTIRKIKSADVENNYMMMTGKSTAVLDSFVGEPMRKTPYLSNGVWRLNMPYGGCSPWDGEPQRYSYYA